MTTATSLAAERAPAGRLTPMHIGILGPLEVHDSSGDDITPVGSTERQLLAALVLAGGKVVSSDRLIETLWGDDLPGNPTNALQARVSRLRKSLGADTIVTRPPGYLLDPDRVTIDAERFEELTAAARDLVDPSARAAALGRALDLWRGDALADLVYEDFARIEAERLEELRLAALEARIDADLESGAHTEVVAELEALVGRHPLREGFRRRLMLALYRSGRQAEALRAYQDTRTILAEELGIDPSPDLRSLEERILLQDPTLAPAPPARSRPATRRLPARLTSFVGRDRETREVASLLGTSRLVTITGPGGVGKTTLAATVASDVDDRDVVLVDLGPVSQPELVPVAFATAIVGDRLGGFRPGETTTDPAVVVEEWLADVPTLLLVDNCEHLIDDTATLVERFLLAAPELRVLATSREPVGIPGEIVFRLSPLGLPEGLADAAASEAVRLFVERAVAVDGSFDPSEVLEAIVDICRRLDGMPLAIELAAARVGSLTVPEIAARLDDRFRLLTGGGRTAVERHRTLRATIDWSYRLLDDDEQLVFRRLSLLSGSFDLPTAEHLAAGDDVDPRDVVDIVGRLVDRSMLIHRRDQGRYRFLETIRAFGRDRLAASGEGPRQTERTIRFYADLAVEADRHLRGHDQLVWLARLDREYENVAAVLEMAWAVAPDAAVEMTGALGWYWYLRGMNFEAEAHLARADQAGASGVALVGVLFAAAILSLIGPGDPARLDELLVASRTSGYRHGEALALALMAASTSDGERYESLMGQAERIFAETGDDWGLGVCSFLTSSRSHTVDGALSHAIAARDRFVAVGDRWGQGIAQFLIGAVSRALGRYDEAMATYARVLEIADELRFEQETGTLLAEMGNVAALAGDFASAAEFIARAADGHGHRERVAGSILNAEGLLARRMGRFADAVDPHRRATELYRGFGAWPGVAYSAGSLGRALLEVGDRAAAAPALEESLRFAAEDDPLAIAFAVEGIAGWVLDVDPRAAALLLGAADRLRCDRGRPLPAGERFEVDAWMARLVDVFGEARCELAYQEGYRDPAPALDLARTLISGPH